MHVEHISEVGIDTHAFISMIQIGAHALVLVFLICVGGQNASYRWETLPGHGSSFVFNL